ncbi:MULTISPECIES: BppU family phage baseplate upper protein [unclassified Bacillus cereus group]|uniref:BppU family phage baseplate upper protein n=1 Tax=unclassified Bacillus cereus group TaxID=2750818 RepID=UPI001F5A9182|nr:MULTISPECIES: BppU family phage baseplate upper protein [unclassified Bacillus cereus group]
MRNEEIIIDLADPVFTKTIRSRQNDKNGLKLTVYAREKGIKLDLTGYAVKYEATNHTGVFIRDDAQIVDAKNGVFAYTLSSQAVSTSDDWTAYFVMEKSTERMSTPDIRITLRRDVKEGNIKIENYISDFEILKKQIDELQRKLNTMDVVKKSGDTMSGDLKLDTAIALKRLTSTDENKDLISLAFAKNGTFFLEDRINSNFNVFVYSPDKKEFIVGANTNLVKKTGDSFTGTMTFGHDAYIIKAQNGTTKNWIVHHPSSSSIVFAPETGPNTGLWDWTKQIEFRSDGTIKQATDTGWINLPTTGVENIPDRILKYKRSGDQITVIGSVKYLASTTVFATLPAGFRPVQNIAFPALAYGNGPTACEVTVKSDGGIFLNGVQNGNVIHIAMNFLI